MSDRETETQPAKSLVFFIHIGVVKDSLRNRPRLKGTRFGTGSLATRDLGAQWVRGEGGPWLLDTPTSIPGWPPCCRLLALTLGEAEGGAEAFLCHLQLC